MKTVSSTIVVFLSVVVIALACFDEPTIETPPLVVQAHATVAMRQWQTEVAQLYQSQRETAEPVADAAPGVQLASTRITDDVSFVRPASMTIESMTPSGSSTGRSNLPDAKITDWAAAADSAQADAARWQIVAETMTPRVRWRSRSFWAWAIAMIAGGISVLGLLACHFWDPERTIGEVAAEPFALDADPEEISLSIPAEWVEIRQSIGVRVRHVAGWGLVITALIAVTQI